MTSIHRRRFLQNSLALGAGVWLSGQEGFARALSPNDKLNLGVIGVSGRGGDNLAGVSSENIVALCDVDDDRLNEAGQRFPSAGRYNDYRDLLDRNDLDAVVVSTPDHTHAVITSAALKSGRHVYCEKPLTHTVAEARAITETARKHKRVTQIGTQIHAGANYRRVVELVKGGVIGPVREVHVWLAGGMSGGDRPKDAPPVPPSLHYDLWIGPAAYRPYSPEYLPFNWRKWWDFGNGMLGDFGCHYMDLPFWALDLRYPASVESEGPPVNPETTQEWLIARYEFPERGSQPPVALTWYHGGKRPEIAEEEPLKGWGNAVLFIGEKGMLVADYDRRQLLPEKEFEGFAPPAPTIPDSIGHHQEWILACKTGGTTTCNFDYSGPLTEAVLLGNVAYRTGKKLEWDAKKLRAENCPEADPYLKNHYRKGWKL
jgi:predicted dehydrogenase